MDAGDAGGIGIDAAHAVPPHRIRRPGLLPQPVGEFHELVGHGVAVVMGYLAVEPMARAALSR